MNFKMNKLALLVLFAVLVSSLAVSAATNPLDAFGDLVVGEWETEDSRHVLEWGVGQRAIHSKSYFKSEDEWTLVGEGMWFWDPSREVIRGIAVAVGMPVELFEYSSQVGDGEIVHELFAQGPAGGQYVERWIVSDDEYAWSLEVENEGKAEKIMAGSYRRVGVEN